MNKTHKQSFLFRSIPWQLFKRLATIQISIIFAIILISTFVSRNYLKQTLYEQVRQQATESTLRSKQEIGAQRVSPLEWCLNLSLLNQTKVTLINFEGLSICENGQEISIRYNLSNLKEIQQARQEDFGESIRIEPETQERYFYYATTLNEDLLDQGGPYYLRYAFSLEKIDQTLSSFDKTLIFIFIPLIFFTSLISLWGSAHIVKPLRTILKKVESMKLLANTNLEDTSALTTDEQWIAIEKTLDHAKEDIENYINELFNENTKISTLMESISDSILAVDKEGLILFANRHFKKNFISQTDKNLVSLKYWEVTRDLNIQELINRALKEKSIIKMRTHPMRVKRNEQESYFDITVSPLSDYDQNIFGVVCVFHDVTERIKADQMREDFVTNVSHEVRTPLTAMKGHVQLLRSTLNDKDKTIHQSLKVIEKNSDRLAALFQDILNLSVIESTQKIVKNRISTEEITETVIINVKQSYPDKNMKIEREFQCQEIWGDSQLIEQVLTNLIDNAFKYTPTQGHIKLVWKQEESSIFFEIHDNSEPISSEHHSRIFERFYRVDSSRSRELGGTGLGLAIVKHIVQKHQGRITLTQSRKLGGNLFRIEFPLKKPSESGPSISYL